MPVISATSGPGPVSLTVEDLLPFAPDIDQAKAAVMIEDALALAARVAPCITDDTFEHAAAAKAILRGAVLRWNDSGSGAVQQQTAGPFNMTVDTRQQRRGMFWPSEITQLQELCKGESTGAFAIDTVSAATVHQPWCDLNMGGTTCSCGASLAGFPIYEL